MKVIILKPLQQWCYDTKKWFLVVKRIEKCFYPWGLLLPFKVKGIGNFSYRRVGTGGFPHIQVYRPLNSIHGPLEEAGALIKHLNIHPMIHSCIHLSVSHILSAYGMPDNGITCLEHTGTKTDGVSAPGSNSGDAGKYTGQLQNVVTSSKESSGDVVETNYSGERSSMLGWEPMRPEPCQRLGNHHTHTHHTTITHREECRAQRPDIRSGAWDPRSRKKAHLAGGKTPAAPLSPWEEDWAGLGSAACSQWG